MRPAPLTAGPNLAIEQWQRMRLRAIFDYCKWDPQCGDQEVLGKFPLFLSRTAMQELSAAAEALTREALSAEEEILTKPELWSRLNVPPAIRSCLRSARNEDGVHHVRVMRFDFHYTDQGWQISEVNADVPGGYVEASGWNALFAEQQYGMAILDPTKQYANAICERLERGSLVALAHATVYSEDRQVMVHLGRELQRRGMRICLVSPNQISWRGRRAMFATSFEERTVNFVVRLLPAEWLPSCGGAETWEPWFGGSKTPLGNPGRAILLQSKRFALAWDALSCALPTWRSLLPEVRCPSEVRRIENGEWVVKPAFGRVGEDVGIRGVTGAQEYDEILRAARRRPEQWVAQKRFHVSPVPTDDGDVFPCIGVYTVNGKFAGLYGRAAFSPLVNGQALDLAVLVRGEEVGRER